MNVRKNAKKVFFQEYIFIVVFRFWCKWVLNSVQYFLVFIDTKQSILLNKIIHLSSKIIHIVCAFANDINN